MRLADKNLLLKNQYRLAFLRPQCLHQLDHQAFQILEKKEKYQSGVHRKHGLSGI